MWRDALKSKVFVWRALGRGGRDYVGKAANKAWGGAPSMLIKIARCTSWIAVKLAWRIDWEWCGQCKVFEFISFNSNSELQFGFSKTLISIAQNFNFNY